MNPTKTLFPFDSRTSILTIVHGGVAHTFLLYSEHFNLVSCTFKKGLIKKSFTTGRFDTDIIKLLNNIHIVLNTKVCRFARTNTKWQSTPIERGKAYTAELVAFVDNGRDFANGNIKIAKICHLQTKPVNYVGDYISIQNGIIGKLRKSAKHPQFNSIVFKENKRVVNAKHKPNESANFNDNIHSKIKTFWVNVCKLFRKDSK